MVGEHVGVGAQDIYVNYNREWRKKGVLTLEHCPGFSCLFCTVALMAQLGAALLWLHCTTLQACPLAWHSTPTTTLPPWDTFVSPPLQMQKRTTCFWRMWPKTAKKWRPAVVCFLCGGVSDARPQIKRSRTVDWRERKAKKADRLSSERKLRKGKQSCKCAVRERICCEWTTSVQTHLEQPVQLLLKLGLTLFARGGRTKLWDDVCGARSVLPLPLRWLRGNHREPCRSRTRTRTWGFGLGQL